MKVSVVIPTVGRVSLGALLERVPPAPDREVVIVDDRPHRTPPLPVPEGVRVVAGRARGPAAARNTGWRAARYDWIAFLDDDVLPDPDWPQRLASDLAGAGDEVGGVQGVLRVPLPADRAPTDWERVTAGLTDGAWITADMAYRRAALAHTGGFDERLPRAFREDAELAFRVRRAGWTLRPGRRTTVHPVRAESPWVSLRTQRGNADDALLRRLYGPRWRELLEIPPGRRARHFAITSAGVAASALGLLAVRGRDRRRAPARTGWALAAGTGSTSTVAISTVATSTVAAAAAAAAAVWAAGTAEFAAARIRPGPRDRREVAAMLATSVAIPPVAIAHWLRGRWRWRHVVPMDTASRPGAGPSVRESGPAGAGTGRPPPRPAESPPRPAESAPRPAESAPRPAGVAG